MLQISGEKYSAAVRSTVQQRWLIVAAKRVRYPMCYVQCAMEIAVKNKCAMERVLQ